MANDRPADLELCKLMAAELSRESRSFHLRSYRCVVVGSEMVDWMVKKPWCSDRAAAVQFGKSLVSQKLLHHVTHEHDFEDANLFYRFAHTQVPKEKLNSNELAAKMYDIVVVGAGSGGITAAYFAADMGVRVALVEKWRVGGDCTWSGCVPSKALIKAAKMAHHSRKAAKYGVLNDFQGVDMKKVKAYVKDRIQEVYQHESPPKLKERGIDLFLATASFVDKHTLKLTPSQHGDDDVDDDKKQEQAFVPEHITTNYTLLCTGAHAAPPNIKGLDTVKYQTYETIFDNEELPKRLVVIGTGPIGMEIGQAYSRFGSKVTVVGRRLLGKEEKPAQDIMAKVFAEEDITHVSDRVREVSANDDGSVSVHFVERKESVVADMILVAIGRVPTVEGLGLDNIGVKYSAKGIEVNKALRTACSSVYAAGDCIGSAQFTHYAGWQAFQAARNILAPGTAAGTHDLVPWCTYTDPEVAHAGLTLEEAQEKYGDELRTLTRSNLMTDRAVVEDDELGYMSLHTLSSGRIVGATVVGARAGEVLSEITLAMEKQLTVEDIARTIHPYPTYSFGLMAMTAKRATNDFFESLTGRILRKLNAKK